MHAEIKTRVWNGGSVILETIAPSAAIISAMDHQ
jgi:hypothetical protein